MDILMERFLAAETTDEINDAADKVFYNWKPAYVWGMISAVDDPQEMKRLHAVYTLGWRHDRRAVPCLIRVLGNQQETSNVRGQAAESLGILRKRKAIAALVEGSRDPSPEVRFWCVFALGHFVRKRKTPAAVARALEARLGDLETPDGGRFYWAVGLEALVMLRRCKTTCVPAKEMFQETMFRALRDPLNHPDHWQWVTSYWNPGIEEAGLFDAALHAIAEAGCDPVTFGRETA
jgi:hypothetical protein